MNIYIFYIVIIKDINYYLVYYPVSLVDPHLICCYINVFHEGGFLEGDVR